MADLDDKSCGRTEGKVRSRHRLLKRLYDRIFAARILEAPLKEDVLRQIDVVLSEGGIGSEDRLQEDGTTGGPLRRLQPSSGHRVGVGQPLSLRLGLTHAIVEVKSNLEAPATRILLLPKSEIAPITMNASGFMTT
jgi:hypothetical protein